MPDSSLSGHAPPTRCGLVALVGRPNVGKSTLLNYLLGQKISITSRKPQTTRHRLLGIKTLGEAQLVYVDTPGLHRGVDRAINRYMNRTVQSVIHDVDVVLFVVDALHWNEGDELVLQNLDYLKRPVFLVINKADQIADKSALLPHIEALAKRRDFAGIVPVSALKGHNVERLEASVVEHLPQAPHMFPDDQLTDRNSRFFAAEFIREKITRQLGEELPYEATVEIEEFKQEGPVLHIAALILVEKPGQKKILIGREGERLKLIGAEARYEMERLFGSKVMLRLWVKVKSGWSDDERALRSLGYDD